MYPARAARNTPAATAEEALLLPQLLLPHHYLHPHSFPGDGEARGELTLRTHPRIELILETRALAQRFSHSEPHLAFHSARHEQFLVTSSAGGRQGTVHPRSLTCPAQHSPKTLCTGLRCTIS